MLEVPTRGRRRKVAERNFLGAMKGSDREHSESNVLFINPLVELGALIPLLV